MKLINILILFTILFISLLSCGKKSDNLNNNNKKEINPDVIKKIEKLDDVIYVLAEKLLYSFKENDTISEKNYLKDDLIPLDIMACNDKLYVLGLIKYKLKLISGNGNEWEEISLPDYLEGAFIDTLLKRYKYLTREESSNFKKYDIYNPDETDNYKKFYNFYNLLSDNIFLIRDKSINLISPDTLYYYSKGKWIPKHLPSYGYLYKDKMAVILGDTIGHSHRLIGYENRPRIKIGVGNTRVLKDSILYYALKYEEWGYIINVDFREDYKSWNVIFRDVCVSQIIPDTSKNSFYYSTNFTLSGSNYVQGILAYYGSVNKQLLYDTSGDKYTKYYNPIYARDSNNLIYNFASDEYVKMFRPKKLYPKKGTDNCGNRTVIQDMQKINEKFFILTTQGIFLIENNNVKKIIDDTLSFNSFYKEGFYRFFVDNSENIYVVLKHNDSNDIIVYQEHNVFLKFTKTNNGYLERKITFYD